MSPYNVGPAAPDESIVFGACRPEHPRKAPPDDSVNAWLAFMDDNDIERVCCLLDGEHLDEYADLLDAYRAHFGTDCVCHAPIPDFRRVDEATLQETILPFLETADDSGERVVVHCSAGQGRTGHILALWLVHGRGYALDEAIAVVQQLGRSPMEAATRSDLAALAGDPNEDSEIMLGIDEEHVLKHLEGPDVRPDYDDADACLLAYNQTDPTVISDGIDRVAVVKEADDRYLVDYWGYEVGALWVTRDGVAELGSHLLGDRAPIPRWLVHKRLATGALPWWVPDEYNGEPDIDCIHCGTAIPAGDILTPGSVDGNPDAALCKECWDAGQDRY